MCKFGFDLRGGIVLLPTLYRNSGESRAVKQWDVRRFDKKEAEARYKQRRNEGNPYGN